MQGGFVAFYNSKIKIFYRLTSGLFLSESKLGSLREKSFRIALFFYLSVVIGRENLCLPLNQSATELTKCGLRTVVFSRFMQVAFFPISSHWILVSFSYALTGFCDYFDDDFRKVSWKML